MLASHTDDPGSSPGSGTGSLPSGATDEAPGQVVSLVKGSPNGEPGGPSYLLITGVSPLFIFKEQIN